jgi:hypothetical protein
VIAGTYFSASLRREADTDVLIIYSSIARPLNRTPWRRGRQIHSIAGSRGVGICNPYHAMPMMTHADSPWSHCDVIVKRKVTNGPPAKTGPVFPRIPVTVRLPEDLITRIDEDLHHRDVPLSRNNWLLEAAIQKLRSPASVGSHGTK